MNIPAKSPQAKEAYTLVDGLQAYFVSKLNSIALQFGEGKSCEAVTWGRDGGKHGGGVRYEARDSVVFDRGSVNVSQVHYDDDKSKKLGSATAISTIIHPRNPHAPSMHMHISWTQMRDGEGYWRVMADLNPSIIGESDADKKRFSEMLKKVTGELYEEGAAQGDRYFYIPVLGRHRGVSHYYLEGYNSGNFEEDKAFVLEVGERVIDKYIEIVSKKLIDYPTFTEEEKEEQLAYHTLYLFQVLTLDRGTTSGLLVHDQNDVGIMGSIPSHVSRDILESWVEKMPPPQDILVQALLKALPNEMPTPVDEKTKKALAQAVRKHYKKYPEALSMQASGEIIPPTVDNHS
ncbi:coproporphyrinogen III oxidase [Sulfurovum sp. TSL6]|uniref:coproporphyrinogen III oxidase n=1 Tax=Sulfurovum sp. TSL6 TaxID=2826995 RepID=UPI001CC42F3F|nr:coproporphyrinogen III oxidase [Sulfurovum sp. TSL6]GIU00402.1 coproporphyrinogen III oxidase [Sulfurovum sp. TSL6]